MRFAAPELAHQFRVRLHARARKAVEDLDRWSDDNDLPGVIVTAVSRDPSFYDDGRFSWHLCDCAVDIKNRHYSAEQRAKVEAWIRKRCEGSEWEVITRDHGTGPHCHIAYRSFDARRAYEQKQRAKLAGLPQA